MTTIRIERRPTDAAADLRTVRRWLDPSGGQARGPVTPEDVTVATGLPLASAAHALLALSARYPCRVRVNDANSLTFDFTSFERQRTPGRIGALGLRLRTHLARARDPALAVVTLLLVPLLAVFAISGCATLGIAIASHGTLARIVFSPVTLVVTAIGLAWAGVGLSLFAFAAAGGTGLVLAASAVLLPVMTVGGLLLQSPPPEATEIAVALVACTLITALLVWLARALLGPAVEFWRTWIRTDGTSHWVVTLWRRVGGFLFGPADDPLRDERDLTRWIAARRGVLTERDLLALFGSTLEEADSALTGILLHYGGDLLVDDHGAILYTFPALAASDVPHPATPFWDGDRARPPRFFACPQAMRNTVLVGLGVPALGSLALPLVGGLLLPPPGRWFRPPIHGAESAAAALWARSDAVWGPTVQALGAWPWLLVAATLLLRLPAHLLRSRRHRALLARTPLLRIAWEQPAGAWLPRDQLDAALLARLDGSIDEEAGTRDPDGNPAFFVRFEHFAHAEDARTRWLAGDRATIRPVLSAEG